ncbi:MAG: WxcM-like domain-containing protein, partial [Pseudonocardiaceae bacterium]
DQVLIAIHGSLTVRAFDGVSQQEFRLDDATRGLFVPRMLFVELLNFSQDGICLVLTNGRYDRTAFIRTRTEYIDAVGPKAL